MESYRNYTIVRNKASQALKILELIGKPQRTTSKAHGRLHSISVKVVINHQETDGAKNYHDSAELDAALSRAAREAWPTLMSRAQEILKDDTAAALAKAKPELEAALAEIAAQEKE